jgi:hypothetical protein
MTKTRFIWLALLAVLLAGCASAPAPRNVLRDNTVKINLTFPCYFSVGKGKFVQVNQAAIPLLAADPTWQVPEGVTLEAPSVSTELAYVTWSDIRIFGVNVGNEFSVIGLNVHVNATLHVATDSTYGSKSLQVTLPAIQLANSALKATFACPTQNKFVAPNSFVQPMHVYATNGQRIWANIWPILKVILIVIGVFLALVIGLGFIMN